MSLSASLNAALVGLDVASRRAQTVSENVANVGREGFGRRELALEPISPALNGLRTTIQRTEASGAVALRREAGGQDAANRELLSFWAGVEAALGVPGEGSSLADRLAALEARLIDASSRPESTDALAQVSRALSDVANGINTASEQVQASRQQSEDKIVATVAQLNDDLAAVQDLNTRIQKQSAAGSETARLEDQRALALDRIADAVGIRVLPRDFGMVAIISESGQILLDGKAKEISFTPAVEVTPDRFLGLGLNSLEIDGRAVPISGPASLSGGRLEGLFQTRDTEAPEAQAKLDALATELVARFSGPTVDPTLAIGEQGLFVDAGAGEGAASRFSVNSLVDLNVTGEVWRIRDGLNAVAPDPVTPATTLNSLLDTLGNRSVPSDPILGTSSRNTLALTLDVSSTVSSRNGYFADQSERAAALLRSADEGLADSAVDIDEEMRRLIEIEQSYAAAARVVEVVDEMMDRLSRL
jgi:flagellar hook-associated protein 1 FlgK